MLRIAWKVAGVPLRRKRARSQGTLARPRETGSTASRAGSLLRPGPAAPGLHLATLFLRRQPLFLRGLAGPRGAALLRTLRGLPDERHQPGSRGLAILDLRPV